MSAHVRPDDATMCLPGFGPDPVHEALAALSRAADATCSRAARGCSTAELRDDLDQIAGLLANAAWLVDNPVDKSATRSDP